MFTGLISKMTYQLRLLLASNPIPNFSSKEKIKKGSPVTVFSNQLNV